MPWYNEPRKDAYGGDTRRGGAKNLRSGGFRMRKLSAVKAALPRLWRGGYPVNRNIQVTGGKEIIRDSVSSGE